MERMKMMKETLISAVQHQVDNLAHADAKELGEAIDMIKDLAEAMYYSSIVHAMEEKDKTAYYMEPRMYPDYGRVYYDTGSSMTTDPREGRSHKSRKMYMEAKEMHHDKATQLKELEHYM